MTKHSCYCFKENIKTSHNDDVTDHSCMIAEFVRTGKVQKSGFCHFLWQNTFTLGGDKSMELSHLSILQLAIFSTILWRSCLKRCFILEQCHRTEKTDAADGEGEWGKVDQMVLRMPLCSAIFGY